MSKNKKQDQKTEILFAVTTTGLTEALLEKLTITNDKITDREFIAKDLIEIIRFKLWKETYNNLKLQRKSKDEPTRKPSGSKDRSNEAVI